MKLNDIFYDDAWICDPKKCPNCPKTGCHDGFCYHTKDKNQRARGIKRFIFFLEFLISGAPSWGPKYKWLNGLWTWKKEKERKERRRQQTRGTKLNSSLGVQ